MRLFICIIDILLLFSIALAQERPEAYMKAQYTAWHKGMDNKTKNTTFSENKYVLQIGNGSSYYYDPQTFFVDSLENDPNGKIIRDKAMSDALNEFMKTGADAFAIMREKGLMPSGRYKNQKDFHSKIITVWDSDGGDRYHYDVDMDNLMWEICDSATSILNYDCHLAIADYHGRKWLAWFAPEVAVQEGPWQLCGLPGLIMKAETEDGEYGFIITGLQQCKEPFKPLLIAPDKLYQTKRIPFLRMKEYSRRNRSSIIRAASGGKVQVNADYTGNDDFIETDYHE